MAYASVTMPFLRDFCRFASDARYEDLSPEDVRVAKRAFLDGAAVCLAGATDPSAERILEHVRIEGGRGPARVVGARLRTKPLLAALANGVRAHCLDFDDVNHPMMAHPTAVLLPVVFAVADSQAVSGREALLAYAVGLELGAKLGRIVNPEHYESGWHPTSTLGTLAAAAAASRLLGFDPEQTGQALNLAASMASGLRRNFGSMTKPFHAGHAARCGLEAAWLVTRGVTASANALDGPMGVVELFSGGEPRRGVAPLGRPFELTGSGLAVKQYPCCAGSHPVLDGVLALREQRSRPMDALRCVRVRVHPLIPRMMIHDRPASPLEAKFSLRFCVASAVVDGGVDLSSFDPARMGRPAVAAWMDRIEIFPDLGGEDPKGEIPSKAVTIFEWEDGSQETCLVEMPHGSPSLPLPDGAMRAKFMSCAAQLLPQRRITTVLRLLGDLDNLEDLRELTQRLEAPRSGPTLPAGMSVEDRDR